MRRIPLTKGKYAAVDNDDYDSLSAYKWRTHESPGCTYAVRSYVGDHSKYVVVPMHRHIMNAAKGFVVDHIDHNGLNNRRNNLRVVTPSQNQMNRRGPPKTSTTGFMGVSYQTKRNRYRVDIRVNGRARYIGEYISRSVAEGVRLLAVRKYYKEFAGPQSHDATIK